MALTPVFRRLESRCGIARAGDMEFSPRMSWLASDSSSNGDSSVIGISPRKESDLGLSVRAMALAARFPDATFRFRPRSSASCSRSLESDGSIRLCDRPDFLPQLSTERCFLTWFGDWLGEKRRSTEMLPTLCISASLEVHEPRDDGRDVFLAPPRKLRRPLPSRALGAVRGEKPLGGFEVLITGEAAGNSSRSTASACDSEAVGLVKPP